MPTPRPCLHLTVLLLPWAFATGVHAAPNVIELNLTLDYPVVVRE